MKNIVTDSQSFESMREQGCLYVDKTDFVWRLVSSADKSFFLSRPRRFGKSMLLSTMEAYFQGKKELFRGLKIEALAPEEWEQWPVIHIDMASVGDPESYEATRRGLVDEVLAVAEESGVSIDVSTPKLMLKRLIRAVRDKTGRDVVVMIDEYDKPILDTLHRPHIQQVNELLHGFYQEIKSSVNMLHFVFITGVSKFAHTSLFSGMNNLRDISTEDAYATILGYTKQDLQDNFAEHIAAAAAKHKVDQYEIVEQMKDWYDGFRFVPEAETLFNPVSVGKFFGEYKFSNYWYETGTPTFLIEQLKDNPIELEQCTELWFGHNHFNRFSIHDIDPMTLAVQTGYLTIKESRDRGNGVQCRYDFPNREVRQSWSESMMPLMSKSRLNTRNQSNMIDDAIIEGNIEKMMAGLQSLIAGLSYENIGNMREGDYRNLLKIAFTSMGYRANAEDHNIQGRVDLAVMAQNRVYVFELKVLRKEGTEEELLTEAARQTQEHHYTDKYRFDHEHVHALAVVFNDKTHQLVAWREI